jgi:hypothetical protein
MAFKAREERSHTENPIYFITGYVLSIEIFCRQLGYIKSDHRKPYIIHLHPDWEEPFGCAGGFGS